mmetsp:Transcript_606/g.2230  ORF Transcript_606/g.2230 Transcript_606/m.2230 type:complete len:295 (+) Transcript_606:2360-3244(+)
MCPTRAAPDVFTRASTAAICFFRTGRQRRASLISTLRRRVFCCSAWRELSSWRTLSSALVMLRETSRDAEVGSASMADTRVLRLLSSLSALAIFSDSTSESALFNSAAPSTTTACLDWSDFKLLWTRSTAFRAISSFWTASSTTSSTFCTAEVAVFTSAVELPEPDSHAEMGVSSWAWAAASALSAFEMASSMVAGMKRGPADASPPSSAETTGCMHAAAFSLASASVSLSDASCASTAARSRCAFPTRRRSLLALFSAAMIRSSARLTAGAMVAASAPRRRSFVASLRASVAS